MSSGPSGGPLVGANGIVNSLVSHRVCGTISSKVQQYTAPGVLIGPMNFGITCMQSQASLAGSGSCYALIFDSINLANTIQLVRMTAGWSYSIGSGGGVSTYVPLWTSDPHAWNFGVPNEISLTWQCDPYFLNGTRLTGKLGGFTLFDFVHTGPQAIVTTTSSGEGVYAVASTNYGATIWTETTIMPSVISAVNGSSYPPIVG